MRRTAGEARAPGPAPRRAHVLAAAAALFAWVACVMPGCSRRSCKEAREALLDRLCECDACSGCDGCPDDPPCSEEQRQVNECWLSCLDGVSCAAIRTEDFEGAKKLSACVWYCIDFIERAAPP